MRGSTPGPQRREPTPTCGGRKAIQERGHREVFPRGRRSGTRANIAGNRALTNLGHTARPPMVGPSR